MCCVVRPPGLRATNLRPVPFVKNLPCKSRFTLPATHSLPDTDRSVKEVKVDDPDSITKKYGLEAGLWNVFKNKDGKVTAKELLTKYGGAYLLTSISLSLVSFTICYLAVDRGIDMAAVVANFGITTLSESTQEKAGTVALAYAAHKALSPVRFPPTVALTPVIAKKFFSGKAESDAPSNTPE